ncbi:zinc finger domain-containing protein [Streptomyces chartreusis]|uniref:zinc finger domain-containing protein n=1 Tax=Streptomyces chartreusis TaxID=1969 RepID=UPI003D929248
MCSRPLLVVTVDGGFQYEAVPVAVQESPSCSGCSGVYHGSWRLGQAVGLDSPYLCGQPKKNGHPCRWNTVRDPCPVHPTPQALKRQQEQQQAEEERRRQAELDRQQDTEVRRRNLIAILSVVCPHCHVPAASLCRSPKGSTVRGLHSARRQLAGVGHPREYVVEARSIYTHRVEEPPLDADPRTVLGDPLHDRTGAATRRRNAELHEAARQEMAAARRKLWLAGDDRTREVMAQPCPDCGAKAASPCTNAAGMRRKDYHAERVDAAMAAQDTDG